MNRFIHLLSFVFSFLILALFGSAAALAQAPAEKPNILFIMGDDIYAYGCDTRIGRLCKGIDLAKERGWHLISMKNEWVRIFAFEK